MSKGGKTYRNRRQRLFDGSGGECWYCGIQCWQPASGQVMLSRSRIAAAARPSETMATIEHQHDRHGLVAREVLSCMDCNSRKGTISGILDRLWFSRLWEDREYAGESDVVQQASGEAAGSAGSANLHLP